MTTSEVRLSDEPASRHGLALFRARNPQVSASFSDGALHNLHI
jgi:hypothetical protein